MPTPAVPTAPARKRQQLILSMLPLKKLELFANSWPLVPAAAWGVSADDELWPGLYQSVRASQTAVTYVPIIIATELPIHRLVTWRAVEHANFSA
jgi:hypothetical protein